MIRGHAALLLAYFVAGGCQGKAETPPAKPAPAVAKQEAPEREAPKNVEAPSDAQPTPADPNDGGQAVQLTTKPPVGVPDAATAMKYRDPDWFRKDMFPDAKALTSARSQQDAKGLFQSHILFEFPAGTTPQQCADKAMEKVKSEVPDLKQGTEPDGRIKVTGQTDRYKVTLLCGEAKGTTRAYVSFEWTS